MGTVANIFTLKLENKDFNSQLQQASKFSQDYNAQIANSLLEASRLEQKRVELLQKRAVAQSEGDKQAIKSINQQIAAIGSLITAENKRISAINQANTYLQKNVQMINDRLKAGVSASSVEIADAKRREEILSSLSAQRVAEEKKAADLRSGFVNTYVNTPAQNKYNAAYAELNSLKAQGVISEEEYASAIKKSNEALKAGEPLRDSQFNHMIRMMRWAGTLIGAYYALKTAWDATIGKGLEVTAQFEQMEIGIAALVAANSAEITVMGKSVTASEKFIMAQKDAANAVILLRKANIDTPATLEQLTRGFQSALGPAMALGFSIQQTVEYSRLMTLAASALTVPMEQLSQEMRSILNGTIDQNSIVANSLGLTNAQIKAHREQGDTYDFLMAKLKDFNAAGAVVNQSWQGITSNLSDAWAAFTSDIVKSSGIFDGLKSTMQEITAVLKNQNGELDALKSYIPVIEGVAVALGAMFAASKAAAIYEAALVSARQKSIVTSTVYDAALMRNVTVTTELTFAQSALATATSAVSTAMKAVPFVAVAALVTTLATSFFDAKNQSEDLADSLNTTADALSKLTKTQLENKRANLSLELQDIGLQLRQAKQEAGPTKARSREDQLRIDELTASYNQLLNASKLVAEAQRGVGKSISDTTKATQDALKARPLEKSAEELAKEEKERAKAIRERNTQELSALTKIHQAYETQAALEQMANAAQEANFSIELKSLNTIQALKLKQYDAEANALADEYLANAKISDLAQRDYQNNITAEKIYKNRTTYANELLQIQKAQTAEQEKQAALLGKIANTKLQDDLRAITMESRREKSYTPMARAFGKNALSPSEASTLINAAASKYIQDVSGITDEKALSSAEEKFNRFVDDINSRIAEIPDVSIKVKLEGWDDASNAFAGLVNNFSELANANEIYNTQLTVANEKIALLKSSGSDFTEEEFKRNALIRKNASDTIAGFGGMIGAMSGFYSAESKEAKRLGEVQKALTMAKMAMDLAAFTQSTAFTGLFVAQEAVKATAAGTTAVAVAAQSSPWTGFATAAAMAAMLASFGIVLGGAIGGKDSVSYGDAFSAQAANTGTGSVLGDTTKASESITNSLSILSDLAKPEFRLISSMDKSLQSIDQKMGGLSATILRAGGFALGEDFTPSSTTGIGIKVGDTVTKALNTLTLDVIISKLPVIGGLVSTFNNIVGGVIGKVVGGIFGGGTSKTLSDAGITFANQYLDAAVTELEGQSYQTIRTRKKGGWFSSGSTKYNSYFSALDEYTRSQFQLVLGNLRDITIQSSSALDKSSSDVEKQLSTFVVSLGKISLLGKTGDQIKETLTNVFGKIGDDIAAKAYPELVPFQQIGEGLFQTMTRVSSGVQTAEYFIGRLGKSFDDIKYTEIVNSQGDVALEALRQSILRLEGTSNGVAQIIESVSGTAEVLYSTYTALTELRISLNAIGKSASDLTSDMLYGAGGIDELQSATSDYISSFLTQSEQLAYQTTVMRAEFDKLNISMPTTNAAFRAMIEGIDTSTSTGQELFGRLILLSKGFSDLTSSVTSSFKDITSEAQKLSDAFTNMSNSIQDTIDKLINTSAGTSQSAMISTYWEKRAQADLLLSKRGDLTAKELSSLQGLVSDLDSLALSIQGAQVGPTGSITSSLVGNLQDLKSKVDIDNAIIQSRIIDANGATVDVATEGTLTRLANAITDRNALLGIDGSHAGGLDYVPYDGYIAQLHKGERVLTATEANSFGGRTIVNFNTSILEEINNKIYDKINQIYRILDDAQLGSRPLSVRVAQ